MNKATQSYIKLRAFVSETHGKYQVAKELLTLLETGVIPQSFKEIPLEEKKTVIVNMQTLINTYEGAEELIRQAEDIGIHLSIN